MTQMCTSSKIFAGGTALLLLLVASGCTATHSILGGVQQAGMLPMVTTMAPSDGATGVAVNDQRSPPSSTCLWGRSPAPPPSR